MRSLRGIRRVDVKIVCRHKQVRVRIPSGGELLAQSDVRSSSLVLSSAVRARNHLQYSKWVSPIQVVPKKSGITVITNDKGELVPTREQFGLQLVFIVLYFPASSLQFVHNFRL